MTHKQLMMFMKIQKTTIEQLIVFDELVVVSIVKLLIVVDDMIVDMKANIKLIAMVTELFLRVILIILLLFFITILFQSA